MEQAPDLGKLSEMVSARGREEREQRDAKVLRVLRTKDESIATLNGQVQGLERVLDDARAKLAASDRSLQEKHKEYDRLWREHNDSLAASHVKWREAQEEVMGQRCLAHAYGKGPSQVNDVTSRVPNPSLPPCDHVCIIKWSI